MSALPWYAHSIEAYERKTAHLSMIEHGAYRLMMDHYYKTAAPLPANAEHVQRICRAIAEQEIVAVASVLRQFFVRKDDGWHNERADEELARMAEISGKRRKAAKTRRLHGVEPPNEDSANAPANAEQMQTHLHKHSQEEVSSLRSDTSAAASPPAPVLGPVFLAMPTNRFDTSGEEFPVYEPFVEKMQGLYPAVDVRQQLRAMQAWLITNDRQRKTKSGMKRFINGWLSRQQDKGSSRETLQGTKHGRPSAHSAFAIGAHLAADDEAA